MTDPKKSIHETLVDVRHRLDDILPEGVGVSITSVDYGDGKGKVTLTISSWPKSMHMLNLKRVKIIRFAVLDGRTPLPSDLAGHPYLSPEALLIAETLDKLVDQFFPSKIDPVSGQTVWDIETSVIFDKRALDREEIEYIHLLKNDPNGAEAIRARDPDKF
jgi:hypothetical protein